jgi:hypothetical protein
MRAAGFSICGTLAVLAVCMSATPAAALEPGVHVDPGSPAEKQYVLPLSAARQTGGESGSRASTGASAGSLFGTGITPPRAGGGGGASTPATAPGRSSRAARLRHNSRGAGSAGRAGAAAPLPAAVLRAARSQDSSAGSGSWLALLGGGLAVLMLGGFGGTVLRHSRRPTPSG